MMSRFSAYRSTVDDLLQELRMAVYDALPDAGYTNEQRVRVAGQAQEDHRKIGRIVQRIVNHLMTEQAGCCGDLDYTERRDAADAIINAFDGFIAAPFARIEADLLEDIGHIEPYASESLSPRSQGVAAVGR